MPWFETIFGRKPDAHLCNISPNGITVMKRVFSSFRTPRTTQGHVDVDLSGLDTERSRVSSPKLGEIERGPYVNLMRLRDPDRDLVVLAEPQRS